MSQDEFDGLINEYAQADLQRGPDWNVESESLGEYAEDRLNRVDGWARSSLTQEGYEVFANIPASSGMVQLFEELMELNGQPQFNMVSETEFQEVLQDHNSIFSSHGFRVKLNTPNWIFSMT